jgi:hypothetical protein
MEKTEGGKALDTKTSPKRISFAYKKIKMKTNNNQRRQTQKPEDEQHVSTTIWVLWKSERLLRQMWVENLAGI